MIPLFRMAKMYLLARGQKKISYKDPCEISFYCHPWDIDIFNEMNNGTVLTLYDIGRLDLALRTGLAPLLIKRKWSLVVAGSSVRYRKRIHMFDKITMRTQCVGMDERWVYLEQSMWLKEQPCSSVLIRSGITNKQGLVPVSEVIEALGEQPDNRELPIWVKEWIDSEQHRPWPPS